MSSGLADRGKKLSSEAGDNAPDTPTKQSSSKVTKHAPRSMPDTNDDESQADPSQSGEGDEGDDGEMVPAAGRINEKGEVIDDDGNAIGKVTSGNAKDFVDYIVTQEGDILDGDGGVVGKAEPLEDVASELGNYTTKSTKDGGEEDEGEEKSGGGGLGGALGGVGNAAKGVTGAVGKTTKGLTGAVGDTAKGATDTVGKATGTEEATDKVGDTVKGTTDTVGDTAEGATDAVGDTTEGATDTVEEGAKPVTDTVDDATGGATGKVGDTAKEATDKAGETAEGAGDAVEDAEGKVGETAEGATGEVGEAVEGATGQLGVGPISLSKEGEVTDSEGKSLGKLAEGTDLKSLLGKDIKGVNESGELLGENDEVLGQVDLAKEAVEDTAEGVADETGEAVEGAAGQLGVGPISLSKEGEVTDSEGKTLGKLAEGTDLKSLLGKDIKGVNESGELLGENDEVLGQVDLAKEAVEDTAEGAAGEAGEAAEGVAGQLGVGPISLSKEGEVTDSEGKTLGKLAEGEDLKKLLGKDIKGVNENGELLGENDEVLGKIDVAEEALEDTAAQLGVGPFTVGDDGQLKDSEGKVLGKLSEGQDIKDLAGKEIANVNEKGELLDDNGEVLGNVDLADELAEKAPIEIPEFAPSVAEKVIAMFEGPFTVADDGQVTDQNGKILGRLAEGQDIQDLIGKDIKGIDENGNLLGDNDTVLGKVDLVPEGTIADRIKDEIPEAGERLDAIEEAKNQLPDISILEGLNINKAGNVVDEKGNILGRVKEGSDIKKLIGKQPDHEGKVWDSRGNVIGEVEVVPDALENLSPPFEDFPDAFIDEKGKVIYDGRQVGVVEGEEWQKLIGKKVDADGDILDKNGNVIGHAIRKDPEDEPEPEVEQVDYSGLKDKKVNKFGNVVDDKGQVWGHVVQGILKHLVGKKVGDNGEIFNDAGKVIGKAEPVPEDEREDAKEPSPFEDFPDAVVGDKGAVLYNGEKIGIVVEGDEKKLKGKTVDADGDILDKNGNLLGRAERWEEEEAEPEPEVDNSALAGKRINKAGNAVDSHGDIYGRVVEGDLKRLVGKMCDKQGFIRNEGGDVIGKAELIPEAEREGMKEGPFTELPGCTVNKEGHIVTPGGDIVGRLTSGDPKTLFGRAVDDDGDILDKNGNVLGHAERWEPEEVPKDVSPMSGRKVNREGNVVDENGDLIGKLTSGDLNKCAGKKIDDDGDVVDQKGSIVGHVSLLEDIPPETEEEESEEDRKKREQLEQDRKIAQQICVCIEHSLDKIRPICKMITENIDRAERTPEEDRDEEELVKTVKPLIEEGGKILTEANGVIRGLDPDGRISANAKHKTASREATPEEYHLADLLKELTGTVTETIENAKRKLEDMTYAKKELNPLWGLLAEPLFQIIAAVGLLLSGVLGLVGKLLNGLGLGGIVNNLLGGLGLNKVLDGLGLGGIVGSLTGQDDKKKKNSGKKGGGGGFLGIL